MSDKNFKVKNGLDANGAVTITQPNTSTVPLTILANTLATGSNLLEVKRPDGTVRLSIGNDGALGAQNLSALNVRFYSANSGSWPLVLRGQASQTADLQQWRDVSENVLASVSASGSITAVDLTLSGNLTVNGTTTNLNSTNLIIEDKNIIIADVATPTDTTADGAGITIKGATDKTFNWVQSTGRFTSSEPIQSSAFVSTYVYASQIGSTVIGTATLNTNSDTGGLLINTAGVANKGLIIRGAASQTADLQQWQNSDGTVLAKVDASGNITLPNGIFTSNGVLNATGLYSAYAVGIGLARATGNANLAVTTGSTTNVGILVKAVASQSANLQEWQNSAGTVLANVDSAGNFKAASIATARYIADLTSTTPYLDFSSNKLLVNSRNASYVGFIVQGSASQTANLQEWQNSAGTVLSRIGSSGFARIGGANGLGTGITAASLGVGSVDFSWSVLVVKGGATQTGDLQQWQNSAGTVNARIDAYGTFQNGTATNYAAWINVQPAQASDKGIIIRGAASQTADLQQWQNSAGTVNARIDAYGTFQNGTATNYGAWINVQPAQASDKGIIIRGAASQTANLQEWQNSAGAALFTVQSDGSFKWSDNHSGPGKFYWGNAEIGGFGGGIATGQTWYFRPYSSARNAVIIQGQTNQSAATIIVKAVTSQTGNIQEWQDSAGTVLSKIQVDGSIRSRYFGDINDTTPYIDFSSNKLTVNSRNASYVGLVVQGAASQTANLQEWQNSAGLALARIKSSGNTVLLAALTVNQSNTLEVGDNAGIGSFEVKGTSFLTPRAATGVGLIVRGFASQTANLQEWQNSSGTVLAKVNSYGGAEFVDLKINTTSSLGSLGIVTGTTTQKGIVVRGIASQTANLQEWQDSAGSVLSSITYFGGARLYDLGIKGGPEGIGWAYFGNENTSTKNVVVRAFASQTANLTEWQDSAGTALATVSSSGSFTVNNLGVGGTLGATVRFIVTSSGAGNVVSMFRGAASQTANLQEWQNSSATVLASISSAGKLTSAVDASINGVTIGLGGGNVSNNTASGVSALLSNTTGGANTATGSGALYSNTTGVNNTASGVDSLRFNTTGNYNTATGSGALYSSTTGVQNTASGVDSLRFNTTGNYNTASGVSALLSNTTGNYNTASGVNSLNFNTTGSNNTIIGFQAGYSNVTGNASVFLGYQAGYNETGSNKLYIANSNTATPLIGGDFSAKTLTFAGNATVVSQAAATQGLIIKGAASQSANLQEWQNSSGTLLAKIANNGRLTIKPIPFSGGVSGGIYLGDTSNAWVDGAFEIKVDNAGTPRFGFTAPNAATEALTINGTSVGVQTTSPSAVFQVTSNAAGNIASIIKGATSQSANLTEWQNSAGSVLANVDSAGFVNGSAYRQIGGNSNQFGNGAVISGVLTAFGPGGNAAIVPVVIKGAASQTANLQEWQNSAGTALAKIDANGNFTAISKSFDIEHPTKENMRLRYASLEGPENGVYVRGTTTTNIIELPDYWTGLVYEDSITVSLTPVGSTQNIYVENIENNKVYIGGNLEKTFFTVYGERKDIDKLTVEYIDPSLPERPRS